MDPPKWTLLRNFRQNHRRHCKPVESDRPFPRRWPLSIDGRARSQPSGKLWPQQQTAGSVARRTLNVSVLVHTHTPFARYYNRGRNRAGDGRGPTSSGGQSSNARFRLFSRCWFVAAWKRTYCFSCLRLWKRIVSSPIWIMPSPTLRDVPSSPPPESSVRRWNVVKISTRFVFATVKIASAIVSGRSLPRFSTIPERKRSSGRRPVTSSCFAYAIEAYSIARWNYPPTTHHPIGVHDSDG